MQTALLPGLIRTLQHARLQYFWVKGEHSMPNKEILHSVGEPGLRLAWRSKYGLPRLLNFQIDIRILKSSEKNIKEIPCFSLMGFFLIPCHQSFSDLGSVPLSHGWVLSETSELGCEQESWLLPLQQVLWQVWQPGLWVCTVQASGSTRSMERLTIAQVWALSSSVRSA